jgi:hypothetical protein
LSNNPNQLLTDFLTIDPYSLALDYYNRFFSGDLNLNPTEIQVSKDQFKGQISFKYTYDNNPDDLIIEDKTVSIKSKTNEPLSVGVSIDFKYRGNCLCNSELGWETLLAYANNFNYYDLALSKINNYGITGILNPIPISESVKNDKENCSISMSKEYSEKIYDFSDDLADFKFTISCKPSIRKYWGTPVIASGVYYIQNLGYNSRGLYSIKGNGRIQDCIDVEEGESILRSELNILSSQIILGKDPVLESLSIEQSDENERIFNFSASWSVSTPEFTV